MPHMRPTISVKRGTRRRSLAVVAAAMLAVTACSSSHSSSSPTTSGSSSATTGATGSGGGAPYTVQIIGDETGAGAAAEGIPGTQGIQAAFDSVNKNGGVNGHQIKFTVHDSMSTEQGGGAAAAAATSAKPTLVMVAGLSTSFEGALPILKQAQLPTVSITTLDSEYFPTQPWFFSDGTTQTQYSEMFLGQLKNLFGGSLAGKKIVNEYIASPSAQAVGTAAANLAKANGAQIVQTISFPIGATSFASQAQNIVSSGAQAVLLADSSPDAVIIMNALKTAGYTGYVLGSQGADDTATITKIANPQYSAVRVATVPEPGDSLSQIASSFGLSTTGAYFTQGWLVAYMAINALMKCTATCSTSDFEGAANSLGSFTVPQNVAFGPLMLGPDRHYALTAVQWYTWSPSQSAVVTSGSPVDITNGAPTS